jgi:hypothetical protein
LRPSVFRLSSRSTILKCVAPMRRSAFWTTRSRPIATPCSSLKIDSMEMLLPLLPDCRGSPGERRRCGCRRLRHATVSISAPTPAVTAIASAPQNVTPQGQKRKPRKLLKRMAGTTGLEPATSDVTGASASRLYSAKYLNFQRFARAPKRQLATRNDWISQHLLTQLLTHPGARRPSGASNDMA